MVFVVVNGEDSSSSSDGKGGAAAGGGGGAPKFSIGLGVLAPSYSQKFDGSGTLDFNQDQNGYSFSLNNVGHHGQGGGGGGGGGGGANQVSHNPSHYQPGSDSGAQHQQSHFSIYQHRQTPDNYNSPTTRHQQSESSAPAAAAPAVAHHQYNAPQYGSYGNGAADQHHHQHQHQHQQPTYNSQHNDDDNGSDDGSYRHQEDGDGASSGRTGSVGAGGNSGTADSNPDKSSSSSSGGSFGSFDFEQSIQHHFGGAGSGGGAEDHQPLNQQSYGD
ncbi:interleukin enhancer-binding factor 3-like [Oppia nitens]|uniref:interleukin enhancer-binding factor 3-like n=1 Tax=Oppia nitens TaxID=1686743 RepID=UPI0023DC0638|nr:interleukin enhancer-binding factor 3-like [Oppia nitens]